MNTLSRQARPFGVACCGRSSTSARRAVAARAADNQETKEMVAGALKSSVRVVSGGIEKATDALEGVVPDNVGRGTVKLGVQAAVAIFLLSLANNILSFAVTLGGIGLLAFGAVKYFNIDLDEILSAAKGRSR